MMIYEYYFVKKGMDFPLDPNMYAEHIFSFDWIYTEESTQELVYENTAKDSVLSVLEGYNSTILAYGQTGTGKTYTMEGEFTLLGFFGDCCRCGASDIFSPV